MNEYYLSKNIQTKCLFAFSKDKNNNKQQQNKQKEKYQQNKKPVQSEKQQNEKTNQLKPQTPPPKSSKKKFFYGATLIFISGALAFNFISGQKQQQKQQKEKEKEKLRLQIIQKHGDNYQPKVVDYYVQNYRVQHQMGHFIKKIYQDKIKIIVGIDGIGKTESTNYFIRKSKKQGGPKVYYYDLEKIMNVQSTVNEKIQQKKTQFLNFLQAIEEQWSSKDMKKYKSIKLVIDDFRKLKKFTEKDYMQILKRLTDFATNKNIDVICITNSSFYSLTAQKQPEMDKLIKILIVQQ